MHRRQKTQKYLNLRFSNTHPRPSVKYTPLARPHDSHHIALMKIVVEELVMNAEKTIALREKASKRFEKLIVELEEAHNSFCQFEHNCSLNQDFIVCEAEPPTVNQTINLHKGKSKTTKENRSVIIPQSESEISNGAPNEEIRESCMKKWRETKKCNRSELVPLNLSQRTYNNQDHNQELQQFLRRKKQILQKTKQSKWSQRGHTELKKTMSTGVLDIKKRENRHIHQDDEGRLIGTQNKLVKSTFQNVSIIKLSHIKILAGQQTINSIKKKPIIDMPTSRRTKRKAIGDTCVLIQQMYDQDLGKSDLGQVLEQAWRPQKGTMFSIKEHRTSTFAKLPILR